MITFLNGSLESKEPMRVILDVHGVGYEVFIPLSTYDRLPARGATCRLLTYDHVREDAHILYGFATEDERRMFLMLTDVTGIGPRIALSALSGMTVREMMVCVVEGDVKRLSSLPVIGKKTAERLVVELKHKIDAGEALEAIAALKAEAPVSAQVRDALQALISLGYKQDEARKMIQRALDAGAGKENIEELVRRALAG